MRIKPRIRLGNQLPIETSLRNARLVSCYKQYGITPPIKGKGDAPNAASRIELLPLATERNLAVIVNRPFRRGDLIERFAGKPLPEWAAEIGCTSWPQFLLKFAVSHPAVTCAIPATSRADHMRENMGAAAGAMPDAAVRARMIDYVESL
jgi:predicted aldo/keto reductase-like oxidoreductase